MASAPHSMESATPAMAFAAPAMAFAAGAMAFAAGAMEFASRAMEFAPDSIAFASRAMAFAAGATGFASPAFTAAVGGKAFPVFIANVVKWPRLRVDAWGVDAITLTRSTVMASFIPSTDGGLFVFSQNFKTLITATPTAFGLTAAQATAYGVLHDAFAADLAACAPPVRTPSATAAKNTARASLKAQIRLLADLVNGTAAVTDAQKLSLGLTVRRMPSPIPAPAVAPGLDVLSVSGWTVKVRLHDVTNPANRGKPAGVIGASVFTAIGAEPPADITSWKFEGSTGRTIIDIVFPDTLSPGAKVFLTAFWFNPRKQSGPACDPVTANLPGGGVSMAA